MASLDVEFSWSHEVEAPDLEAWHIYVSNGPDDKGRLVHRAAASDRIAKFVESESIKYVRAVPVIKGGIEGPWSSEPATELFVQGRRSSQAPPAAGNVAVGHVAPSLQGQVSFDAPLPYEPAHFVQVIEGPDADTGKLIAERAVENGGLFQQDAARQTVASFPLEGATGATKQITVRTMGTAGRRGGEVARTVQEPDELPGFHAIAVASWNGSTLVNFPAAAATDAHEFDATDGARLRKKPALNGLTGGAAGWGTLGSGIFASSTLGTPYLRTMTIESDEVDLGAVVTFRLSIADTLRRDTAAGDWPAKKLRDLGFPMVPAGKIATRRAPLGPLHLMREIRLDGKPRQPLRDFRWEYVVGDTSPVDHATSDYVPWTPGLILRGRYMRVRLIVREPTGMHQVICPTAVVTAHVERRSVVGTGSPESAVAAPPGSQFQRTDGPPWSYAKGTGVGNTGWKATNASPDNIAGPLTVTGIISPAQFTADQHNYAPTGNLTATIWRISADAPRDLTGIANGANGRMVTLLNIGAQQITLKHESASSSAANRFSIGADHVLAAGAGAVLFYDGTSSRWRKAHA